MPKERTTVKDKLTNFVKEFDVEIFSSEVQYCFAKSYFVFHLASFHHQINMKLRSDINSWQWTTDEFGVPIRDHFGKEYKLYQIEDKNSSDTIEHQPVLISYAALLENDKKRNEKNVKKKNLVSTQVEKIPERKFSINIEEHQNKENENPVNEKEGCRKSKLDSNEWRDVPRRRSSIKVPKDVTTLRDAANNWRGSYVPQRMRVKMGTKALSDAQKENVSVHT
ncbi:hypothetical protein L9F63_012966 [Diploptera punctata]|uniref:Uncharacterized protein n=1 Tax=Diploptera punctata TaxID=6984 RepID=A0AAD8EMM6_DIPPU|nr:hypothetical protein L9F63_012966 [Diploptera punctata]